MSVHLRRSCTRRRNAATRSGRGRSGSLSKRKVLHRGTCGNIGEPRLIGARR